MGWSTRNIFRCLRRRLSRGHRTLHGRVNVVYSQIEFNMARCVFDGAARRNTGMLSTLRKPDKDEVIGASFVSRQGARSIIPSGSTYSFVLRARDAKHESRRQCCRKFRESRSKHEFLGSISVERSERFRASHFYPFGSPFSASQRVSFEVDIATSSSRSRSFDPSHRPIVPLAN